MSLPTIQNAFKSLLRADFIVQWKQRRALIMSLLVPVIFLIAWKSLIPLLGALGVLAVCISVGLPSTGLMGYSQTIARDRERGVFQRLRTTPVPTWVIMASRIIVQLAAMAAITLATIIIARFTDNIHVAVGPALLAVIAAIVSGASFIAIGQLVVGLVKSSEAVNAVARLLYSAVVVIGAIGETGLFGQKVVTIVEWSPFGLTKTLLVAAMSPNTINAHTGLVLLASIGYTIVFAGLGIKYFQWTTS